MIQIKQIFYMSKGQVRTAAINCTDDLDSGVALTGTPTITTPSGITAVSPQVNTSTYEEKKEIDGGGTVAVGKAILFKLTAGTTEGDYIVEFSSATDNTGGDTVVGQVLVRIT